MSEEGERDGAAVQADLRAVIERAADARAVLGLAAGAGLGEARTAFHALCKKYHPARFARSSPETVRLANEAFLAIKRAYDGLVRPEPKPEPAKAPIDAASQRLARPVAAPPAPAAATAPPTAAAPAPIPPTNPPRPSTGAIPPIDPARGPAVKQPAQPRPTSGAMPAQPRGATGAMPAQPRATSGAMPAQPRAATGASPAQPRPTSGAMPAQPRPATGAAPAQPRPATGAAPAQPRATSGAMPAQPRPATGASPAQPHPSADDALTTTEEQRFAAALDLIRRRLWKDGERAMGELAVMVPSDRKYRAYRHYARGRIAQDEGRLDEARTEWERALRLDPDFTAARSAMEQLPEQPKPPSGGLLSKLFKRS